MPGLTSMTAEGGMSGGPAREKRHEVSGWPAKLLQRLPKEMQKELRFAVFSDALVLHPEEPRAMFRPIEELALNYPKDIDIRGKQFGKLSVLSFLRFQKHQRGKDTPVHYDRWEVKCECGVVKEVGGNHLRTGNTKSCGHGRRRKRHKHGS